jgi:putative DNA primase/helicase
MKTRTANWLQEATRLLDLGLSVIPLHSPDLPPSAKVDERNIGKAPLVRWQEYQDHRPSVRDIRDWARRWPRANLGVVTGAISSVIVLDSDGREGASTLEGLGPLPRTWRVSTGHGKHIWFKHPGGDVKNFSRRLPGLDLRADGGYVVVPPSRHRIGRDYRWLVAPEDTALAEPPDWLIQLIGSPPGNPMPIVAPGGWVAEALLEGVPEGSRDSTCTPFGGLLPRLWRQSSNDHSDPQQHFR